MSESETGHEEGSFSVRIHLTIGHFYPLSNPIDPLLCAMNIPSLPSNPLSEFGQGLQSKLAANMSMLAEDLAKDDDSKEELYKSVSWVLQGPSLHPPLTHPPPLTPSPALTPTHPHTHTFTYAHMHTSTLSHIHTSTHPHIHTSTHIGVIPYLVSQRESPHMGTSDNTPNAKPVARGTANPHYPLREPPYLLLLLPLPLLLLLELLLLLLLSLLPLLLMLLLVPTLSLANLIPAPRRCSISTVGALTLSSAPPFLPKSPTVSPV
jgi:hypothetical protein